jgi:protein TonB
MQTLHYSNGFSPKPGRSIATIALVGSLHLILVYAVLAALDIVPAPSIPGIAHLQVINKTVRSKPDTLPPIHPTMATPKAPDSVPVPKIPIDPNSDGGTITVHSDTGVGPMTQDVVVAVSAIAATHTSPSYPALDRRMGHEGTVLLSVTIDAQGNVSDASVAKSSGFEGLDAAAVSWVKAHWRYHAAMRNGHAIPATSMAEVTFRLTQN